ncbi:MAG: hypothetical protein IKI37_00380, partial [Oscillospiraceae bacterium]|nr:hypothetical protein [Oscillospiraceae bacterium]
TAVRAIQQDIVNQRKSVGTAEKGQQIGTYQRNSDTRYFMSKIPAENWEGVEKFLDTHISYRAVARDGKMAFALDKDDAPLFHRALQNAEREINLVHTMQDMGLSLEQMTALSPTVHRLATDNFQLNIADFFDNRYDDAQFGEMLSLVNDYLSQSPAERFSEHSKLNDMLEAKSSFDRSIELSEFFSSHDFSDEQKAAISAMFVGDVTRGQIEDIDETFTVQDIHKYDEILHTALQESEITDFLTAHKQKEPTEEEILFSKADLADFIAYQALSSDEWEDMAYPLFENGYTENHKPSEKALFGHHLPEKELYTLAERFHNDEDISHDLAVGLLAHTSGEIEFVFDGDKMSDRTYYYADNLRHSLSLEYGEDGITCKFGDIERFSSFEEIGQAFLDRILDEFNDLMYWRVLDYIRDDIPDIEEDTVSALIVAFDEYKDNITENQAKIKQELNKILHDDEQTDLAFACIAKQKYNFKIAENTHENGLFIAQQNSEVRYYKTAETADTLIETAKTSEHAFIDLDKMGTRISEAEFAEIEQSDHVNYSADFDLDNRTVQITEINGIAESDRNNENISVKTIGLDKAENSLHFGIFGNGITVYDTERIDSETHDYMTVAHISDEGNIKLYTDDISPENIERINEQAQAQRDKFMESWNALSAEQQFQKLLDNADISTNINIHREKLNMEQTIEKYMPYVFFGEGERPEPENTATFQIYQLPDGEKYHGIRFEDLEQLSKDGVQLNYEDYQLVYEGEISDFKGNETLENLFGQFNTNRPDDFTGRSLSVSDVIVVDNGSEKSAYYCDRVGFTEIPQFFREKEISEEKTEPKAVYQVITNAGLDGGIDDKKEYSSYAEAVKAGQDYMSDDYLDFAVFNTDTKKIEYTEGDFPLDKAFNVEILKLNGINIAEDKGSMALYKMGDFYEFYGEDARNAADTLGLYLTRRNDEDMVGFPNHVRDEYLKELTNAGYTVVVMGETDRELTTLQDVVDVYFGTDCEQAETTDGTWKLAIADGDKVGELFHNGEAVCGIYNHGNKMAIEPYQEMTAFPKLLADAMLAHNPDKPVEIMDFERVSGRTETVQQFETDDIDKPLFTDSAVIEEIQKNQNDDVPFWEKPDIEGEQLSLFGDSEPLTTSKPAPTKSKSEFAKGPVVDGVQVYEALAAEIDRGTGFVHGKFRVQDFYEEKNPTVQELADFLKSEYGTGGHSGEGKISLVDYDSKGMTFSFENSEKFRHSWYNVATMVDAQLKDDTYLSAEQKTERASLKEQTADEPHTVEIGDKFRNKLTGEVSEVVSLTGALPFYTDDCTNETNKEIYVTTENISYDRLLNSGLYEFIGRGEPEKTDISENKEVSGENKTVSAKDQTPDTPTIKSLAQLKRTLQVGMEFEISAHARPDCVDEHRIITGVNSVGFTSKKLDEDGKPYGDDIHMEWDKSKNWSFDNGEFTSTLDNGELLMSFHIVDGLEHEKEKEPVSAEISSDNTEKVNISEPTKANNFTITDSSLGEGGAKAKFRANIDAIHILKTLEKENRPATADEKETLSKYVGWGAIPQAFDKTADKWSAEYAELKDLLTPQEYAQARASVNDAFYTSPTVIEGIYQALKQFGFEGGRVLEPAMGVGNFFGCMPSEMAEKSELFGVEIDSISGRIAQKLYPDADIAIQG